MALDNNAVQVADLLVGRGDVLVEGDLVLRDTTGHWLNTWKLEHAEGVVVLRPRMLMDIHAPQRLNRRGTEK